MLAGNLFTPKWKHRKVDVRKQALLDLAPAKKESQKIFFEVVRTDAEIEIRKLALKRINDISTLLDLAESEPEDLSVDINRRLGQLMTQADVQSELFDRIVAYLNQHADPELLKLLLSQSGQELFRKTALLSLDKNSLYADTAMTDASASLRLFAIERINKISTLERVLKFCKTKDKAVYKIAKQKLDAHNNEKNKPKQIQQAIEKILVELKAIVSVCKEQNRWAPQQAQINVLLKNWIDCIDPSSNVTADLKNKFDSYYQQYQLGLEQEKADSKKLAMEIEDFEPIKDIVQEYCEKLRQITADLDHTNSAEALLQLKQKAEQIEAMWQQILTDMPTLVDSSYMQSTLAQFKKLWQDFHDGYSEADKSLKKSQQRKDTIAKLQTFMQAEKPVTSAVVNQYNESLKYFTEDSSATNKNEEAKSDRRLYKQLLQQLSERLSDQTAAITARLDEIAKIVSDLERALVNGKAKFAVDLTRRWVKLSADLDSVTRQSKKYKSISSDYKKLQPKVSELREWREWSNSPVKEKLCQEVELLAEESKNNSENSQYNHAATMEQLKAYRREWNKLVDSEFKPDKKLEKKFTTACDTIYQTSQSFFSGLADQRQSNLDQRQQYCVELESYYKKICSLEISEVDLKHLDKVIRVSHKEWHSLGVVDRVKKEAVNKQFNEALTKLTDIRNKIRDNNAEEKNTLLAQAQKALTDIESDSNNIASSIDAVKRLQAKWKSIGVATKDQYLWKDFQRCCNDVFEFRNSQNKEKAIIRDQQREQLKDLCSNIEALSKNKVDDSIQVKKQFTELRQQWSTMSVDVNTKDLDKRYKIACQEFEKKMQQLRQEAAKENNRALAKLWNVCFDLETLLANCLRGSQTLQGVPEKITSFKEVSEAVTVQSSPYAKILINRIQRLEQYLNEILAGGEEVSDELPLAVKILKQQPEAVAARKSLCLHAEILANVESPLDDMPDRLKLQVSMLASRMTQGGRNEDSIDEEVSELLNTWHQTEVVIDPTHLMLENRFANAIGKIAGIEYAMQSVNR